MITFVKATNIMNKKSIMKNYNSYIIFNLNYNKLFLCVTEKS